MDLHLPDERRETLVSTEQTPVDGVPPVFSPPLPDPPPPPPPPAGSDVATGTETSPASPSRPRRRATAWLVGAGATVLAVTATALGVWTWDLDNQVSDLTTENGTLTEEKASLGDTVSDLTAERDAIQQIFPLTQESWADADLAGTYEFLFVPVEGQCTYADCDQLGSVRYSLTISRTSDGYALSPDGAPGGAPMSREGSTYSTSGVLPESMWSTCDGTPGETSFEMHLTVAAVGLAGAGLRAVEASGTYRQYAPADAVCGAAESTSTFTARRTD